MKKFTLLSIFTILSLASYNANAQSTTEDANLDSSVYSTRAVSHVVDADTTKDSITITANENGEKVKITETKNDDGTVTITEEVISNYDLDPSIAR